MVFYHFFYRRQKHIILFSHHIKSGNIQFLLSEPTQNWIDFCCQFKPLDIRFTAQELPIIQARSLSLKRLIGNLINNAKRYGAEPIEISAQVENNQLLISVADHGEGIPADQIEDLMQPFVRGNDARTIQGSGLGLAIVKRIVDIHNGQILIQNREQGGLEAIISLPLSKTEVDEVLNNSALEKIKQTLSERF